MNETTAEALSATVALINRLAHESIIPAAVMEAVGNLSAGELAALNRSLDLIGRRAATALQIALEPKFIGRVTGPAGTRTTTPRATAVDAAWAMRYDMERHGLRYGEMGGEHGHIADLAAGHVLTADDHTEFSVTATR